MVAANMTQAIRFVSSLCSFPREQKEQKNWTKKKTKRKMFSSLCAPKFANILGNRAYKMSGWSISSLPPPFIFRFYDPSAGVVEFDGVDVKKLNLNWLRDQIGLVNQVCMIFIFLFPWKTLSLFLHLCSVLSFFFSSLSFYEALSHHWWCFALSTRELFPPFLLGCFVCLFGGNKRRYVHFPRHIYCYNRLIFSSQSTLELFQTAPSTVIDLPLLSRAYTATKRRNPICSRPPLRITSPMARGRWTARPWLR